MSSIGTSTAFTNNAYLTAYNANHPELNRQTIPVYDFPGILLFFTITWHILHRKQSRLCMSCSSMTPCVAKVSPWLPISHKHFLQPSPEWAHSALHRNAQYQYNEQTEITVHFKSENRIVPTPHIPNIYTHPIFKVNSGEVTNTTSFI